MCPRGLGDLGGLWGGVLEEEWTSGEGEEGKGGKGEQRRRPEG